MKRTVYLIAIVLFSEALLSSSCVYSRLHCTSSMEKGAGAGTRGERVS